jgi:glutamate synthase (NADPH/NADH) small chain
MGKPTGFKEIPRETPTRRTVSLRIRDWQEVYHPMPEDKLRGELARLLGAAASATGAVRGTPGVGRRFEFRLGQYRGAALAHDGGLVHAAIL